MNTKSKREARREQARKRATLKYWGGRILLGVVLVAAGWVVWSLISSATRPNEGVEVPIMEDSSHVETGTIVPYNNDPPTSGPHYVEPMPSGFYDEGQIQVSFPEGYIVHSLEHGYVVFWYNCSLLTAEQCSTLKEEIQSVMDEYNGLKLIAFPRDSIEFPVVLTSWGHMLQLEEFDAEAAGNFIEANRSRPPAPEPNAP